MCMTLPFRHPALPEVQFLSFQLVQKTPAFQQYADIMVSQWVVYRGPAFNKNYWPAVPDIL